MENFWVLILIGFLIGTIGTLIGAGGGFLLVPLLLMFHPEFDPGTVTAISMAIVAANSISGTSAYMYNKRVDYKAGLIFAVCTIPGSILGVLTSKNMEKGTFDIAFGVILIGLATFLFIKGGKAKPQDKTILNHKGWTHSKITDRSGETHEYSYDWRKGTFLSVIVGYLSPILGIGGGIIHVPAMVEWLRFPVHIATATSHFILAIMASVTVFTHFLDGSYASPQVQHLVLWLIIGVIPGAQLGAKLSHKIKGKAIIRSLAVCLALVAVRILFGKFV
ncbi:MAG: sulfite exporter TauE/SafE family protein [Flavobacterium sp.]|uniref:sulfite exporter TauE/SafE family protein n=1 Tax=Flavobacterium sp. TaxID=239 RepID=UPI00120EBEAE|nr:sulfite exporter TauE/SafE family protein [Flavobacterium sp.]RZJ67787.1 MAG: sulfite exporter TauE/SafE family protein [Flavobacterium sp.]